MDETKAVPMLELKRSLSKAYPNSPNSSYRVTPTQHLEALSKRKGVYQTQLLQDSKDLTEYLRPVPGDTLKRGAMLKDKYLVLEQLSDKAWKLLHLEWKRTIVAKKADSAVLKDSKLLETWTTWCTLPQHANIAEAYYLEELEQEQQYLLQEFLNPCTLQQVLSDHEFEGSGLEELISILALDLAQALNHAHTHGLLHLNLVPSNVLLFSAGKGFAVTDFGNAIQLTKTRTVWTADQDKLFTSMQRVWPSELVNLYAKAKRTRSRQKYQEQLELYELLADAKADIFSYGTVLLTAIVGSQTWTSTALLFPEVVDELVASSLLPDLAKPRYSRLIRRAMYDVEETGVPQYQSMAEVLADLRNIVSHSYPALSARPPLVPPEEYALNKRALLLFTLEAWEDAMRLWSERQFASAEWRFNLYVSHWLFGSVTDMEVLNALPTPSEMQLVRIHMMRQDWIEAGSHVLFDACQNDLSYGLLRDAREIYWNKETLKPHIILPSRHEKTVLEVVVAAKGAIVAVRYSNGGIAVLEAATNTVLQEHIDSSSTCLAGCWEKSLISAGRETGSILLFDLHRNKMSESSREHTSALRFIRLTHDGDKVLTTAGDRFVFLWQTTHAIVLHKIWFESMPTAIAIDGNGTRAAVALAQKTYVRIVDIKREYVTDLCLLQGHKLEVTTVAMASDGAVCVTAGLDGKIMFWEVENKLPFLTIRYGDPILTLRATPSLEFLLVKLKNGKCCVLESSTSVTWRTLSPEGDVQGFNLFLTDYQRPAKSTEGFAILKCETEMQLKKVLRT